MNLYNDRIDKFLDSCHSAGIKDPVRYLSDKRIMVYDWLRGVFPRGILPTDIDGEVELGGRFLRMEFKHEDALRDGRVAKGQRLALSRLADTRFFTVFIVGVDESNEPKCIEVFKSNGEHSKLEETSREDLRERCRKWAEWAEANPAGKQAA